MSKQIYLFATSQHPKATSVKSLEVKFLTPKIDFSEYDNLIITSKQTIKGLLAYDKSEFIDKPALCVSVKTAKAYEDFGGKILDVGNGYGDGLYDMILNYPKDTRWLYLRAKVIASDFVERCIKKEYNINQEVLYVSECSQEIQNIRVNDDSTLIFTSPSSIECFLKNNKIHPDAKVVVIGTTTAKALPENIKYFVSDKTSIDSCVDLALNL